MVLDELAARFENGAPDGAACNSWSRQIPPRAAARSRRLCKPCCSQGDLLDLIWLVAIQSSTGECDSEETKPFEKVRGLADF